MYIIVQPCSIIEGSGPPFSQELLYAHEALLAVNRTLARLYITRALSDVEILEVMRALAEQGNELTRLSERAKAKGQ